jgi:hypothetical protein
VAGAGHTVGLGDRGSLSVPNIDSAPGLLAGFVKLVSPISSG